jgi:O-antigen ligase
LFGEALAANKKSSARGPDFFELQPPRPAMARSTLLVQEHQGLRRGILLAAVGIAAILAFYMLNGGSYLPALAIFGVAAAYVVYKAAALTRADRQWLIVPLVMLAIFINSFFLSPGPRAVAHYGLAVLFCLPCVPVAWRSGIFRRGVFELYSIYFLWALVTVIYSLAPEFSAARLVDATLTFCAVSAIALGVKEPQDVTRLVERFVLGCGVFVVICAFAAVALPRSLTWDVPELYTVNTQVERFRGVLSNPNDIGGLMLITLGPTLAFWSRFERRKKKWLAAIALLSIAEAGLADSRTPFVAMAIGFAAYLLWRYRLRGILLMAGAAGALVLALPLFGHSLGEYTGRGDVTTLTGRTEMWAYVVQQIRARPLTGYGYEVAGAIFKSKYFPIWYGPWDEGSQSSLHNGYLSHAIGLGIPATLFWLFIVLRPWAFVLRRKEDPWNLKPLALLVVVSCLVHNMSEASIGDFLGVVGLLFGFAWAMGERYRLLALEEVETVRQEALDHMPPVVAMFRSMKA